MYSIYDSLCVLLCIGAGIDEFAVVLEIFCSCYVCFLGMWKGFWDWKGRFPGLILVDGKNHEDFLLCRGYSFSVVPASRLGTTLPAGGETNYSRGYLEDWEWSHCTSSECKWVQILKSNLVEMLFMRIFSMPSLGRSGHFLVVDWTAVVKKLSG